MPFSHVGKYEFKSSDNFDEFLVKVGTNLVMRKLSDNQRPTVTIKQDGDIITIVTSSLVKTAKIQFQPGVPFEEDRADNQKAMTTVTLEGDKLVHKQEVEGKSPIIITRVFEGNEMIVNYEFDGVKAVRTYTKVEKNLSAQNSAETGKGKDKDKGKEKEKEKEKDN